MDIRRNQATLATIVSLTTEEEMAFDHVGDGTLKLRTTRADHAKRPATGYGARPN